MKLTELNPVWLSLGGNDRRTGIAFECPCCRKVILIIKCLQAGMREQRSVAEGMGLRDGEWVPAGEKNIWQWNSEDFNTMTVTPSVDASASGHWHGNIHGGQIMPLVKAKWQR